MRRGGDGGRLPILGDLDHLALYPLAAATAPGIAMARAATAGALLGLFLGLAVRPLVGLDQGLPVGDRNLIIIRVNFAEGQEAVPVAAVFDEGGLQRRFDAGDLGKIDVAAKLLALCGLEIEFFNAVATDHDDPGFFRVGGIDQHFVGHWEAHGGKGRVERQVRGAQPDDASVCLIRG